MYKKSRHIMAAILLASITMFTTKANAQNFGIGAGLGIYMPSVKTTSGSTSQDTTLSTEFGITIRPFYTLNDNMRIEAYISIYFGSSSSSSDNGTYQSGIDLSNGQPIYSSYSISYTDKISFMAYGANFQYAFLNKFGGDKLAIYGLAGFSMYSMTDKSTETSSGGFGVNSSSSTSHTSINLNIGVGAEYPLTKSLGIFLEPRYSLPISGSSETNGGYTVTTKAGGFNMDAGVRYTFGK